MRLHYFVSSRLSLLWGLSSPVCLSYCMSTVWVLYWSCYSWYIHRLQKGIWTLKFVYFMPWINSQDSRIFKGHNCNYILRVYTICILLRTWDSSEKFRWPIKWCLYLSHSQMHYNLLKIWLIHVLLCNAVSIACIIAWHNAMHTILMRPINCLLIGLDGLRLFPVLRREHLIKAHY